MNIKQSFIDAATEFLQPTEFYVQNVSQLYKSAEIKTRKKHTVYTFLCKW